MENMNSPCMKMKDENKMFMTCFFMNEKLCTDTVPVGGDNREPSHLALVQYLIRDIDEPLLLPEGAYGADTYQRLVKVCVDGRPLDGIYSLQLPHRPDVHFLMYTKNMHKKRHASPSKPVACYTDISHTVMILWNAIKYGFQL